MRKYFRLVLVIVILFDAYQLAYLINTIAPRLLIEFSIIECSDTTSSKIFNEGDISVINSEMLNLVGLTKNDLVLLDRLVSDEIGRNAPTVYWFLKDDSELVWSDMETSMGMATSIYFDGCNFSTTSMFKGDLVNVAAIRTGFKNFDQAGMFGTILHERAHTLGAFHGQAAFQYFGLLVLHDHTYGVLDAYWWGFIALQAWHGNCPYLRGEEEKICTAIAKILAN